MPGLPQAINTQIPLKPAVNLLRCNKSTQSDQDISAAVLRVLRHEESLSDAGGYACLHQRYRATSINKRNLLGPAVAHHSHRQPL